ncbi:MAG: response regulator, partial [Gammaproteobacteria bacterium]|nr:response regulator [Gammaproteobacteria bacterium]
LATMRRRGVRTPVIVLCANSDIATAVAAMRAGADDFIEKPFFSRHFLDCVQRVLKRSNATGTPNYRTT